MVWRRFEILRALKAWRMGRKFDGKNKTAYDAHGEGWGIGVGKMGVDGGMYLVLSVVWEGWCELETPWKWNASATRLATPGLSLKYRSAFLASKLWQGEGGVRAGSSLARSKNPIFLRRHVVCENAFGCSECTCSHLFWSTFWNFLSKNASPLKQGNHDL